MKETISREQQTILRDAPVPLPIPIPPSIHGWMWEYELRWLYRMASELRDDGVEGDILEVGSYKGLSASALGQAGNLTCVDTFRGGEDLPETDSRVEFDRNMAAMGLIPEVFEGRSGDILPKLRGEGRMFRLIFIDGSHEYLTVSSDLYEAWCMVSPGGILVADDYVGFPDVAKACRLSQFGFQLVNAQRSKMAFARKPKRIEPR